MKKIAIYPGSFNPFTIGHLNILEKAEAIFGEDNVVIAVGVNPEKIKAIMPTDVAPVDRVATIKFNLPSKKVESYSGFLTDFIWEKEKAGYDVTIIKGLRNGDDLDYEVNQLRFMEEMKPNVKIMFLVCDKNFEHISSSAYRALEDVKKGAGHKYLAKEYPTAKMVGEMICNVIVHDGEIPVLDKFEIKQKGTDNTGVGFSGTYVQCLEWIKEQTTKNPVKYFIFINYQSLDSYAMMEDKECSEEYLFNRVKVFRGTKKECESWKKENPFQEFNKDNYEIGQKIDYDREWWTLFDISEKECQLSFGDILIDGKSKGVFIQRYDAPWIWEKYKNK